MARHIRWLIHPDYLMAYKVQDALPNIPNHVHNELCNCGLCPVAHARFYTLIAKHTPEGHIPVISERGEI